MAAPINLESVEHEPIPTKFMMKKYIHLGLTFAPSPRNSDSLRIPRRSSIIKFRQCFGNLSVKANLEIGFGAWISPCSENTFLSLHS